MDRRVGRHRVRTAVLAGLVLVTGSVATTPVSAAVRDAHVVASAALVQSTPSAASGSRQVIVAFPSGSAALGPVQRRALTRTVTAVPAGVPAVITVASGVPARGATAADLRQAAVLAQATVRAIRATPGFTPTTTSIRVLSPRRVLGRSQLRQVAVTVTWHLPGEAPSVAPSEPLDVQGAATQGGIAVTWRSPAVRGSVAPLAYRAYAVAGLHRPAGWLPQPSTPRCEVLERTACTITGLSVGQPYTIAVIASTAYGDSGLSAWPYGPVVPLGTPDAGGSSGSGSSPAPGGAVPGPPGTPNVVAADQEVRVSWTAPTSGGGGVSGYRVTLSTSSTGTYSAAGGTCTPGTTSVSSALTCTASGLTNGLTYYFRVAAINADGTGEASASSAGATPAGVPGGPDAPTVTAGDTTATLTWSAPSSGGTAITGYTVQRSLFGGTYADQPGCTGLAVVLTCTATGLVNGSQVTFRVAARNAAGLGPWSTASTSITPYGVPAAPAQPQGIAGITSVAVFWNAPSDNGSALTGFTVLQATSSGGSYTDVTSSCAEVSNFPKATSCTLSGLTAGQAYFYKASATNARGAGALSVASASVTPISSSTAPVVDEVDAGDQQVVVYYTVSASAGETVWSRYSSDSGATWSAWLNSASVAGSLTVTGLTNGTTYDIQLGLGASNPPTYLSGTATALPSGTPGTPSAITAASHDGHLAVSWTAPSSGGSALTGYIVATGPTGTGPWTQASGTCAPTITTTSTATSCEATGLTNGTGYYVRVAAGNQVGYGSYGVSATAFIPAGPPQTPAAPVGRGGVNQVVVSWSAPTTNGSAITGYRLQRASSALGPFADITNGGCLAATVNASTATTCTDNDTGLVAGGDYFYSVAAISAAGVSAYSESSGAVTPIADATAPVITSLTPGDRTLTLAFTYGSPATNVQYSVDGGSTWTTRSPASSTSPLTISGLANGTTYEVQIRMVITGGLTNASASATATPRTVPAAPSALTGTAGNGQVTLTWTAPGDDGGAVVTGYTVQASANGGAYADQAGCTGLGAVLTCTATGLTAGTPYTFTVAAINAAGTGTYSSPSSAITPVAATCAAGGTCKLGDTGPGGGIVFYVGSFTQTSTGQTLTYLEAALSTWNGGSDPRQAWSGNTSSSVSTASAIGTGAANTAAIIAQSPTAGRAATSASAYTGGGKSDWFLGSTDELAALRAQSGLPGLGGTWGTGPYWTSTQKAASTAWIFLPNAANTYSLGKSSTLLVRPIRAFKAGS